MSRRRRSLISLFLVRLVLLTALSPVVSPPTPVGAAVDDNHQDSPRWIPPVDAPVADPFRPPEHRYGPGNRGIEYATTESQPVVAVAGGTVIFAGSVGGDRYVVVDHPRRSGQPRLRSTYAYLSSIDVSVGQKVDQGSRIGGAAVGFHLTARLDDSYVDPALFMVPTVYRVRLVSVF